MTTIKLKADPTFEAPVLIPVPGRADPVAVKFTFKHRTVDEFAKFSQLVDRSDIDGVMAVAVGWELTDDFTKKNVNTFLENYHGAAIAIAKKYISELLGMPEAKQE